MTKDLQPIGKVMNKPFKDLLKYYIGHFIETRFENKKVRKKLIIEMITKVWCVQLL